MISTLSLYFRFESISINTLIINIFHNLYNIIDDNHWNWEKEKLLE